MYPSGINGMNLAFHCLKGRTLKNDLYMEVSYETP